MPTGQTQKDDATKTLQDDGTEDVAGAGTPPASDASPKSWDEWLASQSDEIKGQYEAHVAGLKKALDSERKGNKDAKEKAKRLEELEAAEEAKRMAQLSDLEKLQAGQAKVTQELEVTKAQLAAAQKAIIGYEVRLAARDAGLVANGDVLVLRLMDMDQLEFDDEGKITNLSKLLSTMVKEYPFLKATTSATGSGLGTPAPQPKGKASTGSSGSQARTNGGITL